MESGRRFPDWIWETWNAPAVAFGWLVASLCAAALITWLFRRERRLVDRATAYRLLGLRGTVLLLALLAAWKPMLQWPLHPGQGGDWLIARDVSDSMSIVDDQSSELEKLKWAVATGGVRETPWLRDGMNQLAEGRVPDWSDQDSDAGNEELTRIRSQLVAEAVETISTMSRRDIVARAAPDPFGQWRPRLQQQGKVNDLLFGADVAPVTDEKTVPEVDGSSTNIEALLEAVAAHDQRHPVRGLILFSDGRPTRSSEAEILALAERLVAAGIKVYPVPVGAANRPRDVSLAALEAPAQVQLGDTAELKVLLSTFGYGGTAIPLRVELDGAVIDERTVTADGGVQSVSIPLPTSSLGTRRIVVRTEPRPDEVAKDNNERTTSISITDNRTRVLLVDSDARWEFRYLDAAFGRDPGIRLQHLLFDQPYAGLLPSPFFPRKLEWSPAPDENAPDTDIAHVDHPDLVIIGDVTAEQLTPELWDRFEKLVSEEGAVLVLSAGQRHFPLSHRGAPSLERLLPLTELKRVEVAQPQGNPLGRRQFLWMLDSAVQSLELLRLLPDLDANRRLWGDLPGPGWILTGRTKPVATVWAWGTDPETNERYPLLVQQPYGLGQVVWVGTDATWRWRQRTADSLHHRFWGQLARWAATSRSGPGNSRVRLKLDRPLAKVGEPVRLDVLWSASAGVGDSPPPTSLEIWSRTPDGDQLLRSVEAVSGATPRQQSVFLRDLPEGEYRIRLPETDPKESGKSPLEVTLFVRGGYSEELADVSVHHEFLAKLAETTGGRVTPLDQLATLAELESVTASLTSEAEQTRLWSHPAVLIVIVSLLFCEWFLRRRAGLP